MWKNYTRAALRTIIRDKWYTAITVFSLLTGMCIAVLALLFVNHEYSYDQYHANAGQIYRFTSQESLNGQLRFREGATYPLATVIQNEVPGIEKIARIRHHEDYLGLPLIRYHDKVYLEKEFFWVDASLFDLFSFRFVEGSPETALPDLRSLVISSEVAEKYFGSEPALGKEIILQADLDRNINGRLAEPYTMVVSGVVDIPENSGIRFQVAGNILFSTYERRGSKNNWYQSIFSTYVQLAEGTDAASLEALFPGLVEKYFDKDIKDRVALFLQALTAAHLEVLPGDNTVNPNQEVVNMLTVIAMAILTLACINFTNLSTARYTRRSVEVGVRKVVGASRPQLIIQFLFESLLLSGLAMAAALLLAYLLLPVFNQLMDRSLSFNFNDTKFWLPVLLLTVCSGLIAGLYPALLLSSFAPKSVLKGQLNSGVKGALVRKALVVFQFSATVVLLIGVSAILLQTNYLQNARLDIARDQYAIIRLKEDVYTQLDRYKALKTELLKDASLTHVAGTWSAPFGVNVPVFNYPFRPQGFTGTDRVRMHLIRADDDFIDAFDIQLREGRKLSWENPNDNTDAFVINEAAKTLLGFEDPLGKELEVFSGGGNSFKSGHIVGVMEDFNFLSLHRSVEPLVISMTNNNQYRYLTVRFNPQNTEAMLAHVTSVWDRFVPGWPIELFFMDDEWAMHYQQEIKLGAIVKYLTVIAILIASLGLLALAGFSFEKRKKEMSIRKVLGASLSSIYGLLSTDFIKVIGLSLIVGMPVGWWLSTDWLNGFAYRITLDWWLFALVALGILLMCLAMVSYHSLKSARLNPVDNLKNE